MKEPPRLLEDRPSALERALLDAGASYRCSAAARAKTLEALGVAGGAALTATAVGVATSSWFAKIGWTKLVLGVSAIGAVTAVPLTYQAWQRQQEAQASDTPIGVAPAAVARPSEPREVEPPVEAADHNVEAVSAVAPPGAALRGITGTRADNRPDAPAAGLAEELAALDSARNQLAKGDSLGALARLDAYGRSYPKGRLQLEAEVLRIDALTKSGQTSLAKKRAEAFLRKYPNSVLASRVRALLGP